jgi:nucleoside-diphosphate-sugar epimerase
VHLAPPRSDGITDIRSQNLSAILPDKSRLVYVSTTGVYGDCAGAKFDETRTVNPQNARAVRRVAAEQCLRRWAKRSQSTLAILRVPGIYATDRLPVERLQKGTPALIANDDVYTNHIHADDLARLIRLALFRGLPQRVYHAVDDSDIRMGDYFDLVADAFALPRPPRLPRAELQNKSRRCCYRSCRNPVASRISVSNMSWAHACCIRRCAMVFLPLSNYEISFISAMR